MLRITYRSLTMLVKNALTNPSCGGARNGCGLLTIPRRRRDGHPPRLAHRFCDRRHKTACNTRILTGQTIGVFNPDEGVCFFLLYTSNNSLSPLMVTMTPFGSMAPRSKGMYILQTYIEFLHSLSSAFPPTSTLYNIYIYRPETR